jgi:hypothetical protein
VTARGSQRSGIIADVVGAVRLRDWALARLAGRDARCPDVSTAAWDLFLEGERCALPLQRCLARGDSAAVPPGRVDAFLRRVEVERARVEAACRHLLTFAAIANRRQWPIVVLKGAAAALTPDSAVDMEDVDVLLHPDHVHAFREALADAAYRDAGTGASARHLSGLTNGDLLKIDVHFALDAEGAALDAHLWDRLRPVPGAEGLWTLAPADRVWLTLIHVTVEHPNRRSSARELLLLASELANVEEGGRALARRVAEHPDGVVLQRVLDEARALNRGAPGSGVLRADAAATYTVRRMLRGARLPQVLLQWSYQTAFAVLLGRAARRGIWQRLLTRKGRSQMRWLAAFEDRHAAIGATLRLGGRAASALASLIVALPVSLVSVLARRRVATIPPAA